MPRCVHTSARADVAPPSAQSGDHGLVQDPAPRSLSEMRQRLLHAQPRAPCVDTQSHDTQHAKWRGHGICESMLLAATTMCRAMAPAPQAITYPGAGSGGHLAARPSLQQHHPLVHHGLDMPPLHTAEPRFVDPRVEAASNSHDVGGYRLLQLLHQDLRGHCQLRHCDGAEFALYVDLIRATATARPPRNILLQRTVAHALVHA
mmetsp:Transcript_35771/g.98587  ORF Transcript_35771/g.98587 Transcript_35771/m.98587 type:complete len:204 (-) Transcript_35771:240-851(-)